MKAPFLNLRQLVPLVVPPSGKISKGENLPVSSMESYLSVIVLMIYFLYSSLPALGI